MGRNRQPEVPLIDELELAGASYAKAAESPADPAYNSDVRAKLNAVLHLSDDIVSIHVINGLDPHFEIRLRQPHNMALRREAAMMMGEMFERPVVFVNQDSPLDSRVRDHDDTPQHAYYRDDRKPPAAFVREFKRLKR